MMLTALKMTVTGVKKTMTSVKTKVTWGWRKLVMTAVNKITTPSNNIMSSLKTVNWESLEMSMSSLE